MCTLLSYCCVQCAAMKASPMPVYEPRYYMLPSLYDQTPISRENTSSRAYTARRPFTTTRNRASRVTWRLRLFCAVAVTIHIVFENSQRTKHEVSLHLTSFPDNITTQISCQALRKCDQCRADIPVCPIKVLERHGKKLKSC